MKIENANCVIKTDEWKENEWKDERGKWMRVSECKWNERETEWNQRNEKDKKEKGAEKYWEVGGERGVKFQINTNEKGKLGEIEERVMVRWEGDDQPVKDIFYVFCPQVRGWRYLPFWEEITSNGNLKLLVCWSMVQRERTEEK